ncbi:ABC transporter ATP-binding protein [Butyrivibrio proteoclasticus]|uniref:ABC transporter ATP-binding protein n=1 Tax=Butyrivibrio proteoclasticus TaxID=43305 RepID=UPI00047C5B91|nr:ABC transporter ATP-binding protein [Butyrivibrio proteoclasticus]
MIKVDGISKTYGSNKAVENLSFELEKGKIYGFLGPNGAGKSTTMNIMTGYLAPTEGKVIIEDHDIVLEPEEAKKHLGYLPELPPLYQDMTVEEYLRFVAELKRVPKKERRDQLAKVMKMTEIGEVSEKLIRNLSKGYKQRVGLAQAILGFPELIILDEPTVGLDPEQTIEFREMVKGLKEDHIVLISSHMLYEIQELCDVIMIISHGKLIENGTKEELIAKYDNKTLEEIFIEATHHEAEILEAEKKEAERKAAEKKAKEEDDEDEGEESEEKEPEIEFEMTEEEYKAIFGEDAVEDDEDSDEESEEEDSDKEESEDKKESEKKKDKDSKEEEK